MNYNTILKEIVSLIQEYQTSTGARNSAKVDFYENAIRTEYVKMKGKGYQENFYHYLYQEFSSDVDLFLLLLSIIYKCTSEERCLQMILQYLAEGRLDVFRCTDIRHQVELGLFTNSSARQNYELRRKVHKVQLKQLEAELKLNLTYIPWENRNQNRIVVITNQYLTSHHAPTRNVSEICSALMDMGKEVLLIVAVDEVEQGWLSQSWYSPKFMNYFKEYNGNFQLEYYGHDIRGYQVLIHRNSIEEMKTLLHDINLWNPQIVWYMGGTSLFADLLRPSTTVISMPFSDGYSISEAPILVEYMNSGSDEIKRIENYLELEKQRRLHLYFEQIIRPSLNTYHREGFHLPEDGFIVTVIGNRLDSEITDNFIGILKRILSIDPKIHIAVIGEKNAIAGIDPKRITYLGLHEDLMGVLTLMDLFLNPPRKGGGTGAYWSLYHGIPVVTFDHCDVANCVTEEFICQSEDDMVEVVERYYKDKDYYESMSQKAKAIIDEIEKRNNIPLNIGKLFEQVEKIVLS